MKCERCQRNTATQAVQAEKDGKPCELFVCDDCARKSSKASAVSLADILFSLEPPTADVVREAPPPSPGDGPSAPRPVAACPSCGMTRDALREHRRFGCPDCYEAFVEDTKAFVRELQFGDRHVGRKPRAWRDRDTLDGLRTELASAVERQDFAQAATLRDAISAMERLFPKPGSKAKGASDGQA